jgi:hypothetical protein
MTPFANIVSITMYPDNTVRVVFMEQKHKEEPAVVCEVVIARQGVINMANMILNSPSESETRQ